MGNVNKLICYLIAIQNFAKDIHYSCHGEAFYAKHLLADRIQDGLYNFIDNLKEICLLGNQIIPLSSIQYLNDSIPLIPEIDINNDKANFEAMQNLLEESLLHMQMMLNEETPRGEVSLVDSIAQDLQQKLGLVNMQVKE